uniref:Uncharacterized protein n=1 Tax=Nelumbo nucifera TaxID=4432 RepID=A0A822XJM5_NELNU|nr:TPA_asm: hypothetical protein HUJ06_023207 [Nelumbo nucifera]
MSADLLAWVPLADQSSTFKGVYNSPKGERLTGGSQAVHMNAPRIGGSFTKEDPWNSIIAGAASSRFLQMHVSRFRCSTYVYCSGVLLALIKGTGIMLSKVLVPSVPNPFNSPGYLSGKFSNQKLTQTPTLETSIERSSSSSSWFGGYLAVKRSRR